MSDLWKHRSDNMKCKTCMWFAAKETKVEPGKAVEFSPLGRCRKHAPTMDGYPAVYADDWCGDHKLDENHA